MTPQSQKGNQEVSQLPGPEWSHPAAALPAPQVNTTGGISAGPPPKPQFADDCSELKVIKLFAHKIKGCQDSDGSSHLPSA